MAHTVKCAICKCSFDTHKQQAVKCGRRYAHQKCYPQGQLVPLQRSTPTIDKSKSARQQLHDFLRDTFGDCNWPRIVKQEKKLIDNGYTFQGILNSLKWWFLVEQNKVEDDKADTIMNLVPYIYKRADKYYKMINKAQTINDDKDLAEYVTQTVVYKINPHRNYQNIDLFNLEGDE